LIIELESKRTNVNVVGLVKSNAHSDSGAGNYLRNLKDELRLSKETRKQQRWCIHVFYDSVELDLGNQAFCTANVFSI